MEPRHFAPVMDLSEEVPADIDEPPENNQHINFWLPAKPPAAGNSYAKAVPPAYARRESLLTRQLHSETEHSDDEPITSPTRGFSTVSNWSNPSTISTAELTSDDGRSMPSPGLSPFLPPTRLGTVLPVVEKPLNNHEPKILGLEGVVVVKDPVEADLGRKRCIKFACGNKDKAVSPPAPIQEEVSASPPKRKCALKFMCPSKPVSETIITKRSTSPPPKQRRSSSSQKIVKVHRGSDSTISVASPRTPRKSASVERRASPENVRKIAPLDDSDDSGAEATKFHEFASSEDEPDEWTKESTCYRNRLCVNDTLKKENVIRQLADEVEEEVLAEEEDEDIDDADNPLDEIEEQEDEDSDAGFHSDDEQGFAGSDESDGEGSEAEWWTPGGVSTAATSAEHLDHLTKISSRAQPDYASSLASMSSANLSPRSSHRRPRLAYRTHSTSAAVTIERPTTPDLPDSTDFVCGTLDEDRPKEQAYINCMKEREAAKHRPVPQDIDPTFPTSDPEMDEEDDEDLEDPEESDVEEIMHGSLDSIHGTARRISPTPRRASIRQRSPAPLRHKSPAPRHRSPAPVPTRRRSPAPRHKSPAPVATRHRSPAPRHKSPAPVALRHRSPAPRVKSPAATVRARSPAPKKLFGTSPRRMRSPVPSARMTSPPNTRRASPATLFCTPSGLAQRPSTLTVTASLPKHPGGFLLSRLGHQSDDIEGGETPVPNRRRRGAIDIVKGLEKKKQRRREKLCQKLAAKAAARGEERKKIKPGKGAERMREVGLELQKYKGRAGHILSY